jgi:hypothetical protein
VGYGEPGSSPINNITKAYKDKPHYNNVEASPPAKIK